MIKGEKKRELNKKIKELEKKLGRLSTQLGSKPDKDLTRRREFAIGSSPVGIDRIETIREVVKAKDKAEQRAGLIKTTEEGSILPEDEHETTFPTESIHHFENKESCECKCHPKKNDCVRCYDHPEHLKLKEKPIPPTDGYDEAKILELIEADKAKKQKKHFWQK